MKLRRSRSPVFRCKDQFGGRVLIQRSPGRLTATWFHKLRLEFAASPRNYESIPEIVQQESHLFSMSPNPHKLRPSDRLDSFAAETSPCRDLKAVESAKNCRAIPKLAEHNGESRRIGIRETQSELVRPPRAHVGRSRLFNVG